MSQTSNGDIEYNGCTNDTVWVRPDRVLGDSTGLCASFSETREPYYGTWRCPIMVLQQNGGQTVWQGEQWGKRI